MRLLAAGHGLGATIRDHRAEGGIEVLLSRKAERLSEDLMLMRPGPTRPVRREPAC